MVGGTGAAAPERRRNHRRYGGLAIALPANVAFAAALGLNYLLGDPARFGSASFVFARVLLPLNAWAWLFIALALAQGAALVHGGKRPILVATWAAVFIYLSWSLFFAASLMLNQSANPNSVVLFLYAATMHATTALSVSRSAALSDPS